MKILFSLSLVFLVSINAHGQSKIIFSKSSGALNTGGTPDLMIYDVSAKTTSELYKGAVRGRGEYSATVSPDNSRILVNTYQFSGWKLGIADYKDGKIGAFRKFTSRQNYEYNAGWSGDGKLVAYQEYNWGTRDTEIFVADQLGKNVTQITHSKGGDRNPAWTRDNQSIVFTSERSGNYDIYSTSITGEKVSNLTKYSGNDFAPSTSKQEDTIAFLSDRDGRINLYVMDYDGSNVTNLTSELASDTINFKGFSDTGYWAYQTSWSKDGNYIVFNLMMDSNLELFIVKKNGAELTRITNNKDSDFCPAWIN